MIEQAASTINPLLGAGLSVGGSLINSMLGGIGARRQNKRMVDFWKMNNEYNHPSSQMARLREAGLNPNLVYGNGTVANSSAPPGRPETVPVNIGNPIAAYQDTTVKNAQVDNLRAQNTLLLQKELLNTLEAKKRTLGVEKDKHFLSTYDSILATQLESLKHDTSLKFWKSQLEKINFTVGNAAIEERLKQLAQKTLLNAAELDGKGKLNALRDMELQLKQMNLKYFLRNQFTQTIGQLLGIFRK